MVVSAVKEKVTFEQRTEGSKGVRESWEREEHFRQREQPVQSLR